MSLIFRLSVLKAAIFGLALALSISGCSSQQELSSPPTGGETPAASLDEGPKGLCGPINPGTELTTLSVGNSSGGLSEAYLLWGQSEGCFAKHGLFIDSTPAGGEEKIAALVGGSLDVAAENIATLAITRGNSDIPLQVVSGHYEATKEIIEEAKADPSLKEGRLLLEGAFVVGSHYTFNGLESLRGAKIGVTSLSSPLTYGLLRALAEVGLDATDIELNPLGSSENLKALQTEDLDAAIITGARAYQALDSGATLELYPGAYFYQPGVVIAWLTVATTSETKRQELLAFREAMKEIYALLAEPANQESFKEFLLTDFGLDTIAVQQFSFPPLMTRDVTLEEIAYLVDDLWAEGVIDRKFDVTPDLIIE